MSIPEISITIHGPVGSGKSSIAFEILRALRSAGVPCIWDDEVEEDNLGTARAKNLEVKPLCRLVETNPSMIGKGAAA